MSVQLRHTQNEAILIASASHAGSGGHDGDALLRDVIDGICAFWELTMAMACRRELPLSQFSGPPSSVIRCISRCSP